MVIQHSSPDTLGLKVAQTSVHLKHSGEIKIGDRVLEGPGEYDIAGVGVHAFDQHAVIFAEGLRLTVVWGDTEQTNSEDDAGSDIYVLLLSDAKRAEAIIKEQDPRVVILHSAELRDALAQQFGATIKEESTYKLTSGALPAEERDIVLIA
jgi:hypothetical protein